MKLAAGPSLSAFDMSGNITDGIVTLSDKVGAADLVSQAMLLALETDGMRKVVATLQVTKT